MKMSESQNSHLFKFRKLPKDGREVDLININFEIYKQMEQNQRIITNYIDDIKVDNLRKNFISWLLIIAPRLEVSQKTIFNSISMTDILFSSMKPSVIYDSKNFQLLAVVCFFLSFKFYERKTMNLEFVGSNLLHGKWIHDDIRQTEIFVLEKLNYQIDSINFYSFFQFFELIIIDYFNKDMVKQILFIAKFIMKKAIKLHEMIFNLLPLQQMIIILNSTFLILQQLTNFEIEKHSSFFVYLTSLTTNHQVFDFEKYSGLLINNLSFSEEFLEKFKNLNC